MLLFDWYGCCFYFNSVDLIFIVCVICFYMFCLLLFVLFPFYLVLGVWFVSLAVFDFVCALLDMVFGFDCCDGYDFVC